MNGAIKFKSEIWKGGRILSLDVPLETEVELWLDSREKVKLLEVERTNNGITKYRVPGGSKIRLKLKG